MPRMGFLRLGEGGFGAAAALVPDSLGGAGRIVGPGGGGFATAAIGADGSAACAITAGAEGGLRIGSARIAVDAVGG